MGNQHSSLSSSSPSTLHQPSNFDCEICTETLPQVKKFNQCSHPFCVDCIAHYIQVKVEEEKTADIKCPDLSCHKSLDPLACRSIISPRVFDSWCDVLLEWTLLMSQKTFYCPFRDCSAWLLNECGGNVGRSKCPVCKKLFCFRCRRSWHAGYRCNESRRVADRNDILFGRLAEERKWVRCPVCRHCVERISGCLIVRCRCGIEFCYNCGRKVRLHRCFICQNLRGHDARLIILLIFLGFSISVSVYMIFSNL